MRIGLSELAVWNIGKRISCTRNIGKENFKEDSLHLAAKIFLLELETHRSEEPRHMRVEKRDLKWWSSKPYFSSHSCGRPWYWPRLYWPSEEDRRLGPRGPPYECCIIHLFTTRPPPAYIYCPGSIPKRTGEVDELILLIIFHTHNTITNIYVRPSCYLLPLFNYVIYMKCEDHAVGFAVIPQSLGVSPNPTLEVYICTPWNSSAVRFIYLMIVHLYCARCFGVAVASYFIQVRNSRSVTHNISWSYLP